jgi:hypothetical protein
VSASGSGPRRGRTFSVLLNTKTKAQIELPPVALFERKTIRYLKAIAHVSPNVLYVTSRLHQMDILQYHMVKEVYTYTERGGTPTVGWRKQQL